MTWTLASFALLGVALFAAFAWYERSQPSARVLALVATLAALAALGRIAFAPLPNVKPTTDIVLISGFALGGAPGFAVGAVAALASNFFFGQGPWTPWQMLAWGLAGVGGAGLARLVGHRIRRVPLALACGVAGLVFGLIMNLSAWITFYGAQPAAVKETFTIVLVRAVPFDLAHVGEILVEANAICARQLPMELGGLIHHAIENAGRLGAACRTGGRILAVAEQPLENDLGIAFQRQRRGLVPPRHAVAIGAAPPFPASR